MSTHLNYKTPLGRMSTHLNYKTPLAQRTAAHPFTLYASPRPAQSVTRSSGAGATEPGRGEPGWEWRGDRVPDSGGVMFVRGVEEEEVLRCLRERASVISFSAMLRKMDSRDGCEAE